MTRGLALVVWLAAAAPAAALPGDPPIELRTPVEGASVRAGDDLTYTCPVYRSADFGDGNTITNGEDAYTALVATSARLDGDGRLADAVGRGTGASRPEDPNLCYASLDGDDLPLGRLFWQVSRICSQCSPQFEVSEIRSFELVPATPPRLTLPARVYAGFPFIASLAGAPLALGTEVVVERQAGSSWQRAGAASFPSAATVVLPRGRQVVRARAGSVLSAQGAVRVRPARSRRTKVRGGRWRGGEPGSAGFRVAGRRIKALHVRVTLLCPTPGMVNPFTVQVATAAVESIRLAPDGSFLGTSTRSGSVRVHGRLKGAKLRGGIVEMSLGTCSGTQPLKAVAA